MVKLYKFINIKSILLLLFFGILVYTGCKVYPGSEKKVNLERTWSVYKADAEGTSYSVLSEINTNNVKTLELAWTHKFSDAPPGSRGGNSESNPIIIDGVMYTLSARHRAYALDASTGEQIWAFDPFNGEAGGGIGRGVTYWEEGADKRILLTAGDKLYALNAQTGIPIPSFGNNGWVSMNVGMRGDPDKISVIPTSPGIVFRNLLIIGNEVSELYGAEPGHVRAYDIKSGKLEWTFHTIPQPGEFGYDTWPKDAWKYVGGANNWGGMSLDAKRGMVFFATGSPTYDYYGKDRPGMNLFGNSVVALDAATGKYRWHFQTVHHDLWDYDLPAPPNLITVVHNGKKIDAVAQTSKLGYIYTFNRDTGEPLFPIEERPVPASDIPGEQAWPTQPIPTKPAPYARQFVTKDDISNYSKGSHDSLLMRFNAFRYEGPFTPPSIQGTFMLPGSRGGSSWGGGTVDPVRGIIYVKSNDSPEIATMKKVVENETSNLSVYNQGKALYSTYCVSCHMADKNGDESGNPSLLALETRLSREDALNKIKRGGGKMPSFASVIAGKEEAIISYLFDKESSTARPSREQSFLKEIQENELANKSGITNQNDDKYLNLTAYGQFLDNQRRPGIKPPWGQLHAINLNTGEFEWSVTLGNQPEGQLPGAPETGASGSAGPLLTKSGLLFIGSTRDRKFRAFNQKTGEKIWETTLPGIANANPSTYWTKGKQYVAISVGGDSENPAGYMVTFALPSK
ncbi:MAG: PQQ-binding-like beta-propeller repeat protein [Daejeonella sp.]|uniref:outer membrane protein assembly factor BamB family protein n=1 Tax=Daejeonella sp. TaxID=2805397 RepID=UPI0027358A57|nr:PQQ-binding-like beta-propeller repeat protein [Daejeonella sp.]MDP3469667.1 PQQ-binding-like beta-propeller repeat protein [Daejeonella sp.]